MTVTTNGVVKSYTIEKGHGWTYRNDRWTVYSHGIYPRTSVLAGQPQRCFIESYETLEEAKKAFPTAAVWKEGSTFVKPFLGHLPDEDGDF